MKRPFSSPWLIILSSALLLQFSVARADEVAPHGPMHGSGMAYGHMDPSVHIQTGLSHLKSALHLSESQQAAWETWSQGVLADMKANMEQMKTHWQAAPTEEEVAQTAPDRLAKQISLEEQHLAGFQQRLARQKDALTRTQTFYATLDEKQKSIFDLFEQKMSHERHGFGHGMGHGPEHCQGSQYPHP